MALQTSADSPAPLRQVSTLLGGYVDRLGPVWVEAQVAQLSRRPGICFLTLRDLRATLSIQATCHVSILDAMPVPITEGAHVVVNAKPSFYAPSGTLSLELRELRVRGEGELLAQLERRKRLLAAEGLFDPALKRRLPFLPRAVGLVTGRDSAAQRDVLENARRRWPGVRFVVRHALMQGSQSAVSVAEALRALELGGEVDVVVVARGGGSVEDLLPFSDEALVRAVAACTVPVVSAIGHEPDTPILDLVADVRASTPTDAAKRVVPDVREELDGLAGARARASQAVRALLAHEQHRVEQLRSRPVLANPTTVVEAQQQGVEDLLARSRRQVGHQLHRASDAVEHQLARVRALSPLATLERGYAVAQDADGHVVTDAADAPEAFSLRLARGRLDVRTETVHPAEPSESA